MAYEMSRVSSSLSSVPSNLTDLELTERVQHRLTAYIVQDNDKTVTILNAFLEFLPDDGANNIRNDIVECHSDEEIRQVAANLSTGLLSPSG